MSTEPSGCSKTVGSHCRHSRPGSTVPGETRQVTPSSVTSTLLRFSRPYQAFAPAAALVEAGPIIVTGASTRPEARRSGFCEGNRR